MPSIDQPSGSQSDPQSTVVEQEDQSSTQDWSRTPAAMIAAAILGLASLAGLWWSISTQKPAIPAIIHENTSQSTTAQASDRLVAPARILIDLNTAELKELTLLPSIGPKLAERIINDRIENGSYETLKDLDRVHGIGPKTIQRLADWVTLSQINESQSP